MIFAIVRLHFPLIILLKFSFYPLNLDLTHLTQPRFHLSPFSFILYDLPTNHTALYNPTNALHYLVLNLIFPYLL